MFKMSMPPRFLVLNSFYEITMKLYCTLNMNAILSIILSKLNCFVFLLSEEGRIVNKAHKVILARMLDLRKQSYEQTILQVLVSNYLNLF